ncbi:hypothetical protein MBOT_12050 [Mycobacterium botniense]|uniref:Uncharacterized protein n=1 Tax=Mycobacterium botniense TaxID=84962 RepID=A0A7I9XVN1_9MYCO|nr:hypothetical protein MBOT_12050 [Mycobacterium botniense]
MGLGEIVGTGMFDQTAFEVTAPRRTVLGAVIYRVHHIHDATVTRDRKPNPGRYQKDWMQPSLRVGISPAAPPSTSR